MRTLAVLLLVSCGSVVDVDMDSGVVVDAGSLNVWHCNGYAYCHFPDGGLDARPFSVPMCFATMEEARTVVLDAGPAPCASFNFACSWDGGRC